MHEHCALRNYLRCYFTRRQRRCAPTWSASNLLVSILRVDGRPRARSASSCNNGANRDISFTINTLKLLKTRSACLDAFNQNRVRWATVWYIHGALERSKLRNTMRDIIDGSHIKCRLARYCWLDLAGDHCRQQPRIEIIWFAEAVLSVAANAWCPDDTQQEEAHDSMHSSKVPRWLVCSEYTHSSLEQPHKLELDLFPSQLELCCSRWHSPCW